MHQEFCSVLEDFSPWLRIFYYPESYNLEDRRYDGELHRSIFRDSPREYRHDRSTFHAVIYLTWVTESSMFFPLLVYATLIRTIEIPTFFSGFFYELPCVLIEYVVYSTTESVTPLAHRICCRHRDMVNNTKISHVCSWEMGLMRADSSLRELRYGYRELDV